LAAWLCAPDPADRAYSASPNVVAGFEGAASRRRREKEKTRERIGKRERLERGGNVGEVMGTKGIG